MRELFDEVAGRSPLDPQEAVRQAARTPQRKRFYKEVGVAEAEGGFAITLDGKPIRTPSGRQVVIPSRALADAVAAEWAAQGETISPMTMPLTRIANSVVEGVVDRVDSSRMTSQNISSPTCCSIAPATPKGWSPARPRIGTPCCSGPRRRWGRISSCPKASCM